VVAIYQAAYPRIKKDLKPEDLGDVYTPNATDKLFAQKHTQCASAAYLGLLVQLKSVQRLGRFVTPNEIPKVIIQHITNTSRSRVSLGELRAYYASGAKDRHIKLIGQHLSPLSYDSNSTPNLIRNWAMDAAKTKEALPDIINITLEYLAKENHEPPGFHTLFKICRSARAEINNGYYAQLCGYLKKEGQDLVQEIMRGQSGPNAFGWGTLKNEPKRPTPRNINANIVYLEWLSTLQQSLPTDLALPPTKHRQFINEAKALDHAELMKLKPNKRIAMVIILIRHQYAQTLDNAAQIVIKLLQKMDATEQKHLEEYLVQHRKNTDGLISVLSGTIKVYLDKPEFVNAFDPVLGKDSEQLLQMCEQYVAYANNNYLPFMVRLYKKQRAPLFRAVEILNLTSASEDKNILHALNFIIEHKNRRVDTLCVQETEGDDNSNNVINIRWIREKWWKLVTGKTSRTTKITHVDRACFELCVFERVAEELSAGDLYIPYSETFDNCREQLISWEEYETEYETYSEQVGIRPGAESFTAELRQQMTAICQKADRLFPDDETVRIEK